MSKAQRDKGRRGQTAAENMLRERNWQTDPISAGIKREDIIAVDPQGKQWSVEVKNCANIMLSHRLQAMEQAKKRGLPWMLMSKIHGTRCWVIQRQGCNPIVWTELNHERP